MTVIGQISLGTPTTTSSTPLLSRIRRVDCTRRSPGLGAVCSSASAKCLVHTSTEWVTAPSPGDRRVQSTRLILLNSGVLLVVVGVPSDIWPITVIGATGVAAAVG